MRSQRQLPSEFESLDSTQIQRLPLYLKKTKCINDKTFKDRRKQEALDLAEIVYELFKEVEGSDIIREGQNNA